jgi:osmoprotectant transport system permease protein
MMLAGAIPTALLAVAVDFLFGQAQYWLVPRGVNPLRNSLDVRSKESMR